MRRVLWFAGGLLFAAMLMACGGVEDEAPGQSGQSVMTAAEQNQEALKTALKHQGGGGDQVKAWIRNKAKLGEEGQVQARERDRVRARDGECCCDEPPCGECDGEGDRTRERDRARACDGECCCDEPPCGDCEGAGDMTRERKQQQDGEGALTQERAQQQEKEQACAEGFEPCGCEAQTQNQAQPEGGKQLKLEEQAEAQFAAQGCCCAL